MFQQPDPYENDLARRLSESGALISSSESGLISSLRSLNLGDDFWMYSFKVLRAQKLSNSQPPSPHGELQI